MEKLRNAPAWLVNSFDQDSDRAMSANDAHSQHLILHPNGKKVKGPPNQGHNVGDLAAVVLGFSKDRHEAPLMEWVKTNSHNPEGHMISPSPSGDKL